MNPRMTQDASGTTLDTSGKSPSTIDVLENGDTKITDTKAAMLNSFFSSILTDEPTGLPDHGTAHTADFILKDFEITMPMVRKNLPMLKLNIVSGPDSIIVNIMRDCLSLDKPLKLISNQSLQTRQIPQEWRDGNITPLFKKDNWASPNSYKPVSFTSQVVKIMETLICDQIQDQTKGNGTVTSVTKLLECLNNWTRNFDEQTQTNIIYLDFSKAFDTVPHNRLLLKLKTCGIRGKLLTLIWAFFTNRRQRYILRNVNDMHELEVVSNVAKIFADDTKGYSQIKTS